MLSKKGKKGGNIAVREAMRNKPAVTLARREGKDCSYILEGEGKHSGQEPPDADKRKLPRSRTTLVGGEKSLRQQS